MRLQVHTFAWSTTCGNTLQLIVNAQNKIEHNIDYGQIIFWNDLLQLGKLP